MGNQPETIQHSVRIKRIDEDHHIVFGEVYAPFILDTYGEMMLPDDVEKLAHRFMEMNLTRAIDTQHDEVPNGTLVLESFIAREGDPIYTKGAWVLGVKIIDDLLWAAVKEGKINGYSFQGLVRKLPAVVEVEILRDNLGITELGGKNDHAHLFWLEMDDDGRVMKGRTTTDENHSHLIIAGTATEPANGHSHRLVI